MSTSQLTPEQRLDRFRHLLKQHGVDAYIVPTADAHASEYPPDTDARRMYLTGFTGSAGTAVITLQQALLWTDSRYHEQAQQQLQGTPWSLMKDRLPGVPSISQWLASEPAVRRVAYDPLVMAIDFHERLTKKLSQLSPPKECVPIEPNLVDLLWKDDGKPVAPCSPTYCLPITFTGMSTSEKLRKIREDCAENRVSGCVLSLLDDVAWVTNLRAADISYCPVFLAYMLITQDEAWLYTSSERLSDACTRHLSESGIQVRPYASIFDDLRQRFGTSESTDRVWLDTSANMKLYGCVKDPGTRALVKLSPAQLPKAIKTAEELAGMKEAHIKDAMAKITFLAWLEKLARGSALDSHTEWTVAQHLDGLRARMPGNLGLSFNTISSIGPNGAVIHYAPQQSTARVMARDLYLVDSGGHYEEGTTDVTRTLHLGTPSEKQRRIWTYVLKGHLQLARQRFPKGTCGSQLDVLARQHLWMNGLNYMHGTGHGVGALLNVHEGPQRISTAIRDAEVALAPGMVVSNEPGHYIPNEFGVRIENVVYVKEASIPTDHTPDQPFYTFEDMTLIPYQKRMMDLSLMSDEEVECVNAYHRRVWSTIAPRLEQCAELPERADTLEWLRDATSPVSRSSP